MFLHQAHSLGVIKIENYKHNLKSSFLDFAMGGLSLQLINCTDFSASNGKFDEQESHHFVVEEELNNYQQVGIGFYSLTLRQ